MSRSPLCPFAAVIRETIASLRAQIAHAEVRAGPVLPFELDAIDSR